MHPHLNQPLGDVVGFNLSAWSWRSGRYGHELKDASEAFQSADPIGVLALQLYRKAVHSIYVDFANYIHEGAREPG